jgi:hypothetical protein
MRLRTERLTWREIEDEIVALDVDECVYFTGNDSATVLMKRLAQGAATPQELSALLVEQFDVDLGTASLDVERFLSLLESRGLVDDKGP